MINELSIIIPCLNEEKYLPKLLDSIVNQNFTGQLQVIVVDGHSQDQTVQLAQTYKDQIKDLTIIEMTKGIPEQRNKGADTAKYQYLLFLDADIILPTNFLNRLAAVANPQERFIEFALHMPMKHNFFDYLFVIATFGYVYLAQFFEPIVIGSFIFTTKANHRAIGGFREGIVLAEDVDYGQRSVADGAKYRLRLKPYVYASPRRVRREGRIGLLIKWVSCHMYIKRHGHIYDPNLFPYPLGDHEGDE